VEGDVSGNLLNLDDATKQDLRTLLAKLREYAEISLLHCPGFAQGVQAFGASLDVNGAPGLAVAQLEGEPTAADYRQALVLGFQGQAGRGEIRAAGYCLAGSDRVHGGAEEVPVVWAFLEHRAGVSVRVVIPYTVEGPEKVKFGESFIGADESRIFPAGA
jgi:hypothetical protein